MTGILQAEDEIEQLKKDFKALSEQNSVTSKDSNCLKNQSQKKELIFEHCDL
jgi:archaellum component FlaC